MFIFRFVFERIKAFYLFYNPRILLEDAEKKENIELKGDFGFLFFVVVISFPSCYFFPFLCVLFWRQVTIQQRCANQLIYQVGRLFFFPLCVENVTGGWCNRATWWKWEIRGKQCSKLA
jgi:hypothetical protein